MSVHVVGNSVLDIHLSAEDDNASFDHGWASGNVQFLDDPPRAVLGGNGAATAYALGRLGVPVGLNTMIGSDVWGDVIFRWLEDADVHPLRDHAGSTPVYVVRSRASDGARLSSFYSGSKLDWSAGLEAFGGGWFFASVYGRVGEADFVLLVAAFEVARAGRICFDPGPWFARSVPPDIFRSCVRRFDYLTGTEEELRSWSDAESIEDLMADFLGLGVGNGVVKPGADGASFASEDSRGHIRCTPVEGAQTVGAGNTFNGALIAELYRGKRLEESVRCAVIRAETAVRSGRGVLGAFD